MARKYMCEADAKDVPDGLIPMDNTENPTLIAIGGICNCRHWTQGGIVAVQHPEDPSQVLFSETSWIMQKGNSLSKMIKWGWSKGQGKGCAAVKGKW